MKELNLAGLQNLSTVGEMHNVVIRHPHNFELYLELAGKGTEQYITVCVHSYNNPDLYCEEIKSVSLECGLNHIRKVVSDAFTEMEWLHKKSSQAKIEVLIQEGVEIITKFGFVQAISGFRWKLHRDSFADVTVLLEAYGFKIQVEENHRVIDELIIPYARYGKLLLNSKLAQALHTTEIPF